MEISSLQLQRNRSDIPDQESLGCYLNVSTLLHLVSVSQMKFHLVTKRLCHLGTPQMVNRMPTDQVVLDPEPVQAGSFQLALALNRSALSQPTLVVHQGRVHIARAQM